MTAMYYVEYKKKLLFHTIHPLLNITCSHAIFQIVTHKIIFEKLFSDKCCILCTTTSRHKILVKSMNFAESNMLGNWNSVRLKVLIAEMLRIWVF